MGIESNISQNENTDFGPDSWEEQIDEEPAEPSDALEQPAQMSLRDAEEYLQVFESKELPYFQGKVPLKPELLKALGTFERESPDSDTYKRWVAILGARGQLSAFQRAFNRQRPTGGQPSPATQLVRLCDGAELLQDTGCDRRFYATVKVADHRETYRLDSPDMKNWLKDCYFEQAGPATSDRYVSDAIGVLEGRARREAREVPIHLRCGRDDVIGDVYIDLGRRDWKIVRIKADGNGFELIEYAACPIRFRRSQVMEALPLPETGGTVLDIYNFLNVSTDWRLLDLAALTQAITGNGPLVITAYRGGKGDGKTTTTRLRVSLVDPSSATAAMAPKGVDGLIALARESYFVSLDNLSHLPNELSDALCGLSTGTGIVTRQLYTEFALAAFKARRPIVINSIVDVATRSDLLDRTIIIPVESLADRDIGKGRKRLTERELKAQFEAAAPTLTGALYRLVSYGLSQLSSVKLESTPRMGDFVQWGCAIAGHPSLKPLWHEGKSGQQTFLNQYEASREAGNEIVRESSPIAYLLNQLLEKHGGNLEETPTELLKKLEDEAGSHKPRDFPQSPKALKSHLDRITSELERIGIFIERNDNERPRVYRISKKPTDASNPTDKEITSSIILSSSPIVYKKEVSEVSELSEIEKHIQNKAFFPATSTDTCGESDASLSRSTAESPIQAINEPEKGLEELVKLGWTVEPATRILQAIGKKSATIIERTPQYVTYQCPDRRRYKISHDGQAERIYEN